MIKVRTKTKVRYKDSYLDTNNDPVYLLPTTSRITKIYFLGIKIWDNGLGETSTAKKIVSSDAQKGKSGIGFGK